MKGTDLISGLDAGFQKNKQAGVPSSRHLLPVSRGRSLDSLPRTVRQRGHVENVRLPRVERPCAAEVA